MIFVSGSYFDAATLAHEFAENSVQVKLLQTMTQSQIEYKYDRLDQLKFELSLRSAIVDASVALYRSGLRFAVFRDSFCNQTYWTRSRDGGFLLRDGANPSEAVADIFLNGSKYGTECSTAIMILYYKALLDVYGSELFNRTFTKIYLMNWNIQEPLLKAAGSNINGGEPLLGDRQYFRNPQVNPSHSEWQGENAIVLPNGLYYGHGTGIKTGDEIIKSLNRLRKWGATQSAYLMDIVARPDFKKLADVYHGTTSVG